MADPRPGDSYTEMFSFYVYIKAIVDSVVIVTEWTGLGPETRVFNTYDDFRAAYRYSKSENYWVRYIGNSKECPF